jgi:hypothetical protein
MSSSVGTGIAERDTRTSPAARFFELLRLGKDAPWIDSNAGAEPQLAALSVNQDDGGIDSNLLTFDVDSAA